MKRKCDSDSFKLDRRIAEKNRRMYMKELYFKLFSLIPNPHNSSKDTLPQRDQLDRATIYIKELRERIEELKSRKQLLMGIEGSITNDTTNSVMPGLTKPVIELRDMGSTLEVILISALNKNFMLSQVIRVLEEEGAEVVNVNFSIVSNKIFHTIISRVRNSRIGVDTSKVCERLKELVY